MVSDALHAIKDRKRTKGNPVVSRTGFADLLFELVVSDIGVLKITDTEFLSTENAGSAVEPAIRTRVQVRLELTEPLYERERTLGDLSVITEITSAGTALTMSAITHAALKSDGSWKIRFLKKPEFSPKFEGRKLAQFAKGSYVVSGSKEEAALEARLKAEAIAEQARKAQEKQELLEKLSGTWRADKVLLNHPSVGRVNEVVRINKAGGQWEDLVYEMTFSDTGVPTVKMLGSENKVDPVDVPAQLTFVNGGTVRIQEREQKKIGGRASWYSGRAWELTLNEDQAITAIYRENSRSWSMQLTKQDRI